MKSFREIGEKTGTDKVTFHGYDRFYPIFLEKYRNKEITMLEIGTNRKRSMALWEEYFPKGKLYGIDLHRFEFERGEIFKGNQADRSFLQEVVDKIGKRVDIIIDDGSHVPQNQLTSFIFLFDKLLKDGGIYIIEDIEKSYWKENNISIVEIFKDLVEKLNSEFVEPIDDFTVNNKTQEEIGMISFAYNCIFIIKKDERYKKFDGRKYRFNRKL
jgi:hypothetical protein